MGGETVHLSVLLEEVVSVFAGAFERSTALKFFDGTLGGGGHTTALLEAFPSSSILSFDRDVDAIARCQSRLSYYGGRVNVRHERFSQLEDSQRRELGRQPQFDGILCDLGLSSDQLDSEERGFSFKAAANLDMRMDKSSGVTARDLLNELEPGELARLFQQGGLRRNVRQLVGRIIDRRPIVDGEQFITICEEVLGSPRERRLRSARGGKDSHPATVPFQALRIAVNGEIDEIRQLLVQLPRVAAPGAIAAFITFHSLEDELVTQQFRAWGRAEVDRRFGELTPALGRHLTQKPILPSEEEILRNSRARSAKLRVFKFSDVAGGGKAI